MADSGGTECQVYKDDHLDLSDQSILVPSGCHESIEARLRELARNPLFIDVANQIGELVRSYEKEGFSMQWFFQQVKFLQETVKNLWRGNWIQIGALCLLVSVLVGFCIYYHRALVLKLACQGAVWLAPILQKAFPVLIDQALRVLSNVKLDYKSSDKELHIGPRGFMFRWASPSSDLCFSYPPDRTATMSKREHICSGRRHGLPLKPDKSLADDHVANDEALARKLQEDERRASAREWTREYNKYYKRSTRISHHEPDKSLADDYVANDEALARKLQEDERRASARWWTREYNKRSTRISHHAIATSDHGEGSDTQGTDGFVSEHEEKDMSNAFGCLTLNTGGAGGNDCHEEEACVALETTENDLAIALALQEELAKHAKKHKQHD